MGIGLSCFKNCNLETDYNDSLLGKTHKSVYNGPTVKGGGKV